MVGPWFECTVPQTEFVASHVYAHANRSLTQVKGPVVHVRVRGIMDTLK